MDRQSLKTKVDTEIVANGAGKITGQILHDVLDGVQQVIPGEVVSQGGEIFNNYEDIQQGSETLKKNVASGMLSHAEGGMTTAFGNASHAEGVLTTASDLASHAEGSYSIASGKASHAEGRNTTASGYASHAEGMTTIASGFGGSHAEGFQTTASGQSSHAEGLNAENLGKKIQSVSGNTFITSNGDGYGGIGHVGDKFLIKDEIYIVTDVSESRYDRTITLDKPCNFTTEDIVYLVYPSASGNYSHAEGSCVEASGESSHAEGEFTKASGQGSHAEGQNTKASGNYSHAEGYYTTASGKYSHAEGDGTTRWGDIDGTIASGYASHAEGRWTTAENYAQHTQGIRNVSDRKPSAGMINEVKPLFVIGNGNDGFEGSSHDALRLLNNGNLYLQGVGGFFGGEDYDSFEAAIAADKKTIKSMQEVIADLTARIVALETK